MQVPTGGWVGLVAGLVLAGVVQAQQVLPSCPEQLQEQRYETNMADMTQRYVRTTMAKELRQAVERAEKAEQAFAAAKQAPVPKPMDEPKDK